MKNFPLKKIKKSLETLRLSSSSKAVLLLLILIIAVSEHHLKAQVTVAGAHSSSNGTYTTLKEAFDSINVQSQTGNVIQVTLTASTTETASAVLNAGSWTSLSIYPTVTGLSISGNIAGAPLIDLNGADNITLDGRLNATGTTVDLTITNTSTSSTAGTSTLRLINDACSNTIQYSLIKGSTTDANAGIVFVSTAAAGGNDNNTISNNDITSDTDANRPVNAVMASGTAGNENNGNSISNNNIYNFFRRAGTASQGILISTNNTSWIISGNSFYETASFTPTATVSYSAIYINNTSGISFRINDNYIGGRAASCGGSAWTKTGATSVQDNIFYAIRCNAGTTDSSRIYNNRIRNFSWSNFGAASWYGIAAEGGQLNIGNSGANFIGDTSGTGNIVYTAGGVSPGGNFYAIHVSGTGSVSIRQNQIGSITAANSNSGISSSLYGIYKTATAGSLTIRNNFIGSLGTANSMRCSSASSGFTSAQSTQILSGIYSLGTGVLTIEDNTISQLTNSTSNTSTGISGICRGIHLQSFASSSTIRNNTVQNLTIANANSSESASGVFANSSGATITISGNSIQNIYNSYTNYTGSISGIYVLAINNQNSSINANFISYLYFSSPSTSSIPVVQGIYCVNTDAIVSNNIIALNQSSTNHFYGIRINSNSSSDESVLFNTVYLSGTQSATATANSRCVWMSGGSGSSTFHYIYNNLLHNARTNGGSAAGTHHAIYFDFSSNQVANYNNYFVSGTGGAVGYWPSASQTTFAAFRTASGMDAASTSINVAFTAAGGNTAGSYLPTAAAGNLVLVAGRLTSITSDFTNATRSFYSMGAYDFAVNQPVVQVTATAGTASANYGSLRLALDAINAGTHQGIIDVKITTNLSDNQSATLYQSGYGGLSSYTSINIYPTAANLVCEVAVNAPLLDLNGADNVTIDGRENLSGAALSLSLRNTVTTNGASTLRFLNGAQNNNIRYAALAGGCYGSSAPAVIRFSTSSSGSNSSNTIEYCAISGLSSSSRPQHVIYSFGSASPNGNNNNTIQYNEFYNFFANDGLGVDVTAVGVYDNSSSWTISGNSFYMPQSISQFNGVYHIINVSNTSGVGFQVNNNFIGGTSDSCGGGTFTVTSGRNFWGIRLNVGSSSASNIQGNTIRKLSWSADSYRNFILIEAAAGNVNIGNTSGNLLGDSTTTGSIVFDRGFWFATPQASNFYGININSGVTVNCSNNILAGINIGPANYNQHVNFVGIRNAASSATISSNVIGAYSTANSINLRNTAEVATTVQECYGIQSTASATIHDNLISNINNATNNTTTTDSGRINGIRCTSGTFNIQRNTIRNLSIANASTASNENSSVGGIVISAAGAHTLTANLISGLSNSNSSFAGHIHGLYFTGSSSLSTLSRNFVQGLSASGASSSATIYGIRHLSGQASYINNIIAFGNNNPGTFYGIFDAGAVSSAFNLYNNSVYLSGSPTSGALNSFAFYSNANNSARNIRNNIFSNTRSNNGASGTHYAAFFNYGTSTNLTLDYNNYFASGTGAALGRYNSANVSSLPLVSGLDAMSKNLNPLFANPGTELPAGHRSSQKGLIGILISGITTDFANNSRGYYSMGAYDDLVYSQWNGSSSTAWTTAANWTSGAVPPSPVEVQFSSTAARDLSLGADRTLKHLDFNGSNKKLILGNFNLTIDSVITAGSDSSYVKTDGSGKLSKSIPDGSSFTFHAGNSSYNPLTITNNTGSSDLFSLRLDDSLYVNGLNGTTLTDPRVNGTWHIDKSNPSANSGNGVDLVFQWKSTQEMAGISSFYLNHHNGSGWELAVATGGSPGISGTGTKTLSFPGYKGSFSPFAMGGNSYPLPVMMKSFHAECKENTVELHWSTATELNNARFNIYRSQDTKTWEDLGSVEGAGNSSNSQNYSTTDRQPLNGTAYYQLVQTDYDGSSKTFEPIAVSCNDPFLTEVEIEIYPNPAGSEFNLMINTLEAEDAEICITDLSGRNLNCRQISLTAGSQSHSFKTSDLMPGTYLLQLKSTTGISKPAKLLIR